MNDTVGLCACPHSSARYPQFELEVNMDLPRNECHTWATSEIILQFVHSTRISEGYCIP